MIINLHGPEEIPELKKAKVNKDIDVSILVLVYNHADYISDAMDGFLMQKTDYKYEILVHDDCSTDGSRLILQEYERKHPDKITLLLEQENQYSKHIGIIDNILGAYSSGRYLAFCEGDDYWTDENKLQVQVEAMQNFPNCWISAHTASKYDMRINNFVRPCQPSKCDTIFSMEQVIAGDGPFVMTCSLMIYRRLLDDEGSLYKKLRAIYAVDYVLQMSGAMHGGMLYINRNMGCYRVNVPSSAMSLQSKNKNATIKNANKIVSVLELLDQETNFKYHKFVQEKICLYKLKIIDANNQWGILLKKENKYLWHEVGKIMKLKFKIWVYNSFPWVERLYSKLRGFLIRFGVL